MSSIRKAASGLSALLIAIVLACAAHAGEPSRITALRHSPSGDGVRLILDVDPVPAFALFTVSHPDRLILDFPLIRWEIADGAAEAIPDITELRHGLFRHDRARLILTLARPLRVERAYTKPAQGSEPGRLVIDLAPTTREAFDAAAGIPENARWRGEVPPPPDTSPGEMVVALDPGHGGIDPGAGTEGLQEKSVVLAFARRLAEEIDAHPLMRAVLTRDRDEFVPLGERVARAHRAGANILISIHADSVEEGTANGVSIYTLSEKGTDQAAEALAERENRADVLAGADLFGESDDLTRLLIELAQRGTRDESSKLAHALMRSLDGEVKLLRSRPLRQANFRVLKAPDIPSVLLELGFLDSPRDRARLTDPAWRSRASRALVAGLDRWRAVASAGFVTPRSE